MIGITELPARAHSKAVFRPPAGASAQLTLDAIASGVLSTDANGRIRYMNAAAETLFGLSLSDVCGWPWLAAGRLVKEGTAAPLLDPVSECIARGKALRLEAQLSLIRRDGSEVAVEVSVAPIRGQHAATIRAVITFFDVTPTRRLVRKISYQATHDGLTRLVNRQEFERRLQRLLDNFDAHHEHAVLFMDLDRFKEVNDACGHAAGDSVLREVAGILRGRVRERDTLARLGGDEFALLMEHCPQSQAMGIAYQLRNAIHEHRFRWRAHQFQVGVSIGLVAITAAGWRLEDLLAAADRACYAAKRSGRNRIHTAENPFSRTVGNDEELRWSRHIHEALAQDRFSLYAQPIAPIAEVDATPSHFEVLVRMVGPDGAMLEPSAFIPIAEHLKIMPRIDRWVIEKLFAAVLARGTPDGGRGVYAVNLSGTSLNDGRLLPFIQEQLKRHRVDPHCVCFEITETAAIHNLARTAHVINALKRLGCSFALDDFGSGLSSFAYLKALPVDYLKIDGGFVRNIESDSVDHAMVKCINEIGHVIGVKTVAEFVHSRRVWDELRKLEVDYAQGDIVGAPRPLLVAT